MELEVKILDIDIEEIRKIMVRNKASLVKNEMQENLIFDFPDKRLLKEKGYARIRMVTDNGDGKTTVFMTTKKLISADVFKKMDEHETVIGDRDAGEGIFKALGLELIQVIKKSRESYLYKNSLIEIDVNDKEFVPFPYLEVESPNEEELKEVVSLLGYTMEETSAKSIYEILKERGIKTSTHKGL